MCFFVLISSGSPFFYHLQPATHFSNLPKLCQVKDPAAFTVRKNGQRKQLRAPSEYYAIRIVVTPLVSPFSSTCNGIQNIGGTSRVSSVSRRSPKLLLKKTSTKACYGSWPISGNIGFGNMRGASTSCSNGSSGSRPKKDWPGSWYGRPQVFLGQWHAPWHAGKPIT